MTPEPDMTRNMFPVPMKNMVLMIIALKGNIHGYEIIKEIENITLGTWRPSYGNLYPLLNKMVEDGLIKPHEEHHGKRKRVKYSLTDRGWRYLEDANKLAFKGLLRIIQYHLLLREKLEKRGYAHETSIEILEEYVNFFNEIWKILKNKQTESYEEKTGEEKKGD
jgi:DNA-binding PadR family transcriptional regulator